MTKMKHFVLLATDNDKSAGTNQSINPFVVGTNPAAGQSLLKSAKFSGKCELSVCNFV